MSLHTVNAPLGLHLIHCHDQPESTRRAQTPAKAEELQTNMLKLVISMVMNAYKKNWIQVEKPDHHQNLSVGPWAIFQPLLETSSKPIHNLANANKYTTP